MVHQNNYNSNIKDRWSQIIIASRIKMKKFDTLGKLLKHDIEIQSDQILLGKWC